jgi:hypothetical protein
MINQKVSHYTILEKLGGGEPARRSPTISAQHKPTGYASGYGKLALPVRVIPTCFWSGSIRCLGWVLNRSISGRQGIS